MMETQSNENSQQALRAEIWDLPKVCKSFPEFEGKLVDRDHLLTQVEAFFDQGHKLVVFDGEQGAGSTTLLAQFALAHPTNTFSLFIKTTSRIAYDPDSLREDLCHQLQWALEESHLPDTAICDEMLLRKLLNRLARQMRGKNKRCFFVVDGLDKIPEHEAALAKQIGDMLPWGEERFRLLISGQVDSLPIPIGNISKVSPVPYFSLEEVVQFFDGVVERASVRQIYRSFKVPGQLATVRRLLLDLDNEDASRLLDNLPQTHPNLFQLEWNKTSSRDADQALLLALLAHDRRDHTISDLARVARMAPEFVHEKLRGLSFIEIKPRNNEDSTVEWVSESYRDFAARQLHTWKHKVQELRIDELILTVRAPSTAGTDSTDRASDEPLIELTNYLEEADRPDDLLTYLNPETLAQMLDRSHSLALVQRKATAGIEAAVKTKRDSDLIHLSIQKATLNSLEGAKVWGSEIEAHIALDDFESARTLTQSTVLHADRLHQFAVIAKARHKKGLPADPEISDEIQQLFEAINPVELGEDAINIASDLLPTHPDLAMQLVEKANQTSGENALDWAFARLSVSAMAQGADDDDQPVDAPERQRAERLKSRIQDPAAQQFASVASLLYGYGKYSAEHIIDEVEKLNSAGDRLFMLRQWTMGNAERDDAALVLERALDILVSTTEYVPMARDLRQLAAPLPFIATEAAKHLVIRFSGLRGTLEHRSSTDDDVALQLLLARAEAKYDKEAARSRVLEIHLDLCDVDDLSIKSGCLARLIAALTDIDPDQELEASDGTHSVVRRDLEAAFESLLKTTAEQHDATKTIIGPLVRTHPQLALDWIARLNTYHRRDAALLDFVSIGARLPASYFVLAPIETALSRFVDTDLRDEALLRLIPRLEAMAQEKADKGEEPEFKSLLTTLNRVDVITDLEKRCVGYCLNLSLLSHQKPGVYDGLRDKWLSQLEASWSAIDAQWRQVDVGFKIAAALSERYLQAAHDFMRKTGEVRQNASIDNDTTAGSYLACLLLALRTYCGLLPRKVASPEDFERLSLVITAVPSLEDQVRLWTDLALRCHLKKDVERGADITERFIRPLLSKLSGGDKECRYRCIVLAAPALYVTHQATGLPDIDSLPILHKNEACEAVCRFLLYSVAPSDPCTPDLGQGFRIPYNTAVDVCVMIGVMTGDSQIHYFTTRLVDSIRASDYTKEQTVELINRLEAIVTTKLPAPNGIAHEGYQIACRAQIARLKRDNQKWQALIDAARQLPNSADVVHVLCGIAVAMPQRDQAKREGLLEEVRTIVAAISTLRDRFERYELLAEAADRVNSMLARRYLIEAMQGALKEAQTHEQQASGLEPPTGSKAYTAARRFIDMAHRFDTDWATHLTALADTEPVRQGLKDSLKERVKHLELRKKVANEMQVQDDLTSHDVEEWSRLSWTLLGQLTANRLQPWHRSEARDFVRVASQAPLQDSYPLLAWTIENTVRRHSSTDQARALLHPLFDATLQGAQLALQISARSATQLECARQDAARSTYDEIIDPGERVQALQLVEDWIEKHVKDYLKLCDPFLGPSDTCEILRLVGRHHPDCQVEIMTSRKWLQDEKITQPWQDAFKRQWRQGSDQNPPDTDITVIGVGTDGHSPIHDRWWLTAGSGLQIGTSYSGIGKRGHTIDQLSPEKAAEREATFDRYLSRRLRESEGERISREIFDLG